MVFVSFLVLACVGLFLPSCVGEGRESEFEQKQKLTHVPSQDAKLDL